MQLRNPRFQQYLAASHPQSAPAMSPPTHSDKPQPAPSPAVFFPSFDNSHTLPSLTLRATGMSRRAASFTPSAAVSWRCIKYHPASLRNPKRDFVIPALQQRSRKRKLQSLRPIIAQIPPHSTSSPDLRRHITAQKSSHSPPPASRGGDCRFGSAQIHRQATHVPSIRTAIEQGRKLRSAAHSSDPTH